MSSDQEFRPVRSADRTLDLLELLAAHRDGLTFKEIAAFLHLPKSSLSGLLRTLTARRYITRSHDQRRFCLGARLFELSTGHTVPIDPIQAAEAVLVTIARQTNASAAIAVLDGADVRYISVVTHGNAPFHNAQRTAAHHSTAGKCLLAQLDTAQLDQYLGSIAPLGSPESVFTHAAFKRELAQTLRLGYVYDITDEPEGFQHSIAIPIRDSLGATVAALEMQPQIERQEPIYLVQLLHLLRDTARSLSGNIPCSSPWRKDRIKIAWSMGTLSNQAYQIVYRTVEGLAEELGADIIWTDAQNSSHKQVVDVSSLLDLKPDVLIIHPAHAEQAHELFTLANHAGVTAINFQRPAHSGAVTLFVGGDTFAQGQMTAAFVAKMLNQRGNVAVLSGDPSNDNARNLAQGINAELGQYEEIHVVANLPCAGWSRQEARSLAAKLLDKHGERLHAFLVANDDMAGGVAEALAAQRRTGKVMLVGGDGDLDALERIRSGVQHGTAFQDWMELGRVTLRFAISAASGEIAPEQLAQRSILHDSSKPPVAVMDLPYIFVERSNLHLLERFWTEAISMALPELLPLVAPAFRAMDGRR